MTLLCGLGNIIESATGVLVRPVGTRNQTYYVCSAKAQLHNNLTQVQKKFQFLLFKMASFFNHSFLTLAEQPYGDTSASHSSLCLLLFNFFVVHNSLALQAYVSLCISFVLCVWFLLVSVFYFCYSNKDQLVFRFNVEPTMPCFRSFRILSYKMM
jgi:hypothetical protein